MPHHKAPTVESSGASLSVAAVALPSTGGSPSNRALVARAASSSSLCARTIVETAACPPELRRGDQPWSFSDFRVQRMLGEGSMSSVVHCICARSGAHAAIKMYHRDRMSNMNVKQVGREIEIHASLLHPNVVRLYAAFEDADGIYLVQEWASRGDLYVELSRRGGYMAETHVVKNVMTPFLSALTYMHTQGILHRDIKPENIMLGPDGEVRVGDFGLAINTTREKPMSRVGTLDYMPPEIVRLPYGAASAPRAVPEGGAAYGLPVDAWCVGVLAYELLLGSPPFEADSKEATYTRILKLEPSLPSHLSDQARDFIRQALQKDPAKRPTVHQLLRHPWLRAYQRPKSMVVLESPSKAPLLATAAGSPVAAATVTATALVGPERPVGEAHKEGGQQPTGSPTLPAAAATAPAALDYPAAAAAAAGAAKRGAPMSKSLSFHSAMAGRFSAVKPSKPSPFSMLMRSKHSGSGSSKGSLAATHCSSSGTSSASDRSRSTATLVAAAAVAEIEEEAAAAAAVAAGKAATADRLVIHVEAAAGSTATAALAATQLSVNPTSHTPGAAAVPAADDDLIPAGLPDGSIAIGSGSRSSGGGHSSRGSLVAAIKRKLSSAGGKGTSLFAPAVEGAEVAKDEAAAVALAAAIADGGVGTITAVPMQQLLVPPAASKASSTLKRTNSGRLQALALGFGKKLSLVGRKAEAAAAAEAGTGAQGKGPSRLSAAATM